MSGPNPLCHLVESSVAGGAANTTRPLTHSLDQSKEGLAVDATHEHEEWRPVVGFEGYYEVSSLGRVRSLDRRVPQGDRTQFWPGKMLTQTPSPSSGDRRGRYLDVHLSRGSKKYRVRIHRLVLEAFVGPRPPGYECLHANDIGTDNRVENLRWGTASQNTLDKIKNGRHPMAKRTHCKFGHEFTSENSEYRKTGWGTYRRCRACRKRESRESYLRRKAAS
ncbi:NUMOD4 motif-containing HNH endonuclease [Mycobacterium asiaticum]|uniref:NUMOD4 motif-containing HNH endonuclease n=1 Tax=Mycobacterium asiaticum TaxID=1790 RepID=UPI0009BDAE35